MEERPQSLCLHLTLEAEGPDIPVLLRVPAQGHTETTFRSLKSPGK